MTTHIPVLLKEIIEALTPASGGRYIDGTFGGGGHTRAILEASAPDGRVLAFDRDVEAVARGTALAAELRYQDRLIVVQSSFLEILEVAQRHAFLPVDGILLDLGLSSFQLDDAERGFAFSHDGPLDMRFDRTRGPSAYDFVNSASEEEIATVIWRYGEDQKSRRIARAIVASRKQSPLTTTAELAAIVERAVGGRKGATAHPATRTFQALRIAVNGELQVLTDVLPRAVEALRPGGVLAVISFHSLEDRIVKQFFQRERSSCLCPPELPVCICGHQPTLERASKAIKPGQLEITDNPRSRSAVLRIAHKRSNGTVL